MEFLQQIVQSGTTVIKGGWTRKTIIIKYVAYILYQAHGGDRL